MRKDLAWVLLLAFMLPCCVYAQQSAPDQGELPAGCYNNLGSQPGGAKEYNLFKNLANNARGCTSPSPVTYEKYEKADVPRTNGRSAPSQSMPSQLVSPQQEEADRVACRTEGENAAKAARGLQPGEYDLFKNIAAIQSGEAERVEQSCMAERGYKSVSR